MNKQRIVHPENVIGIPVDWEKIYHAATLLEEGGMPFLARMARAGGTAADQIRAGKYMRCFVCDDMYSPREIHACLLEGME